MPETFVTRSTVVPRLKTGNHSTTTLTDTVTLDLVRSRQKPSPLTDTYLSIIRFRQNHTTYYHPSTPSRCAGVSYGDLGYFYSCKTVVFREVPLPSGGSVTLAQNKAIANLGQGSLDIGVFLAELDDTVKYLATIVRRLGEFGYALKRGDFQAAAKAVAYGGLSKRAEKRLKSQSPADRLASGYLEYQFALRPLISDAQGAVDAYHRKVVNGMVIRSGSGPRSGKGKNLSHQAFDGSGPRTSFNLPPSRPRVSVRGVVKNANARTAQELGLMNLAHSAWNGLPFSFLIDYFLPIGDYLATLTATSGLTGFSMSTVTYRSKTAYLMGYFWQEWEYVYRNTTNTLPSALSRFPTLGSASQSAQQVANMVALAKARL